MKPIELTPDESQQLRDFWEPYDAHREPIEARLREVAAEIPGMDVVLAAQDEEQVAQEAERSRAFQHTAIFKGRWQEYIEDLQLQGVTYARMGVEFASWYEIIRVFRTELMRVITAHYRESDQVLSAIAGMDRFVDIAMGAIGEAYLKTKEQIIINQQEAIREISTPVLQVRERLLILPIIGMVDTYRARQLTEGLLDAIHTRRALVVVMDITGVPVVDSRVANHFLQAVDAAKLMGAIVIITGVSAQIAQTLVTIGASLGGVRTVGDLQGGIELAERLLGIDVKVGKPPVGHGG